MELFRTRRFWSALLGFVFMVGAAFFPELNGQADTLIQAIMVVVGFLIGGFTADRVATTLAEASVEKAMYSQKSSVSDSFNPINTTNTTNA